MKRTPTMPSPLNATKQSTEPSSPLNEQIRSRAYELYQQRGGEDGHDLDDWLQAQSEMTQPDVEAVAA